MKTLKKKTLKIPQNLWKVAKIFGQNTTATEPRSRLYRHLVFARKFWRLRRFGLFGRPPAPGAHPLDPTASVSSDHTPSHASVPLPWAGSLFSAHLDKTPNLFLESPSDRVCPQPNSRARSLLARFFHTVDPLN